MVYGSVTKKGKRFFIKNGTNGKLGKSFKSQSKAYAHLKRAKKNALSHKKARKRGVR